MSAPFRESTEAQVAHLGDRVTVLEARISDLSVKAKKAEPVRPQPLSFMAFFLRLMAADVALTWVLLGVCGLTHAPDWVQVASAITGLLALIGTIILLASRAP